MRAKRVCTVDGCPNLVDRGRCARCQGEADARRRATPEQQAYRSREHRRFRAEVLTRHPICVSCRTAPATVADHHPISRRDLVARGLDPNDARYGRGLCARCHNRSTAQHQPGGWAVR